MNCLFCDQPIAEGDEVADIQMGEAETNSDNEFVGEIIYTDQIETGHLACYEKAVDQFQRKGGA